MRFRRSAMAACGAALGLLALASCGEQPPEAGAEPKVALASTPAIVLSDARVQMPVVQGRPGVAYFTVTQTGGAPRKIASVSVELAGKAEMHRTMSEGGMAAMEPVVQVPLEPGTTTKFEPGGLHVMLFEIDPKLRFRKQARLGIALDDGAKAETQAAVTTVMEQDH